MSFRPTKEGKRKLKELDEFVERHRDAFEKIAESLRARKKRLS